MASTLKWHHELTNGVGKCSVPMWMGGCPSGFCDEPAFGERPTCSHPIWTHHFADEQLCQDMRRAIAEQCPRMPLRGDDGDARNVNGEGCDSTQTIEEIKKEHPDAISCCPERKMVPALTQQETKT